MARRTAIGMGIGMMACSMIATIVFMKYRTSNTLISQTHGDGSTLKRIIKRTLMQDSEVDEGHLYANALRKAGFRFNHGEEDAIATSLQHGKHKLSSLAINPKLQQQIKVADVINQSPSMLHKSHFVEAPAHTSKMKTVSKSHMGRSTVDLSDKIRLAEAILHGRPHKSQEHKSKAASSPSKGASKKAIQATMMAARASVQMPAHKMNPLSIKERMKDLLNRKAERDLKKMWSNAHTSKPMEAHHTSTLQGNFAESFLKKLNEKEASMFKQEESAALSKEELMTAKWDTAKHWEANHPVQLDAKNYQPTALLFGNLKDGTALQVKDGHSMSRIKLEKSMRQQLDAGLHDLQRSMKPPASVATDSRKQADMGTNLIQSIAEDNSQVPENKLEQRLKETITGLDHDLEEKLFHASLAKHLFRREN